MPRGRRAESDFPPNAPPFASDEAGSPPGAHHDASGSRYAGSTQLVASRTPPAGHGDSASGGAEVCVVRRPWILPAAARAVVQRLADDPLDARRGNGLRVGTRRTGDGDQHVAGRGVVGEPAGAERDVGGDALGHATFEPGSLLPRPAGRSEPPTPTTPADAARAIASCTVRQPVQRHRWAASARSTSVGAVRPCASSAAARTTMPGVQNPHCEPPVATKASANVVRDPGIESVDRRDGPSRDPLHRCDAGDPGCAVDEHRAASALTLRRTAVLHREDAEPLAEHRQERLAGRHRDVDRRPVTGEGEPRCFRLTGPGLIGIGTHDRAG